MKKFVIISAVLLLLAAGAFGYALFNYMQPFAKKDTPEVTEAVTEAEKEPEAATEAAKTKRSDTTVDAAHLFADGQEKAETAAASMTTEEMVGQILLGVCADTSTASSEMQKYSLAGMFFESSNFQGMSKEEISSAVSSASAGLKVAPILAAQEEGGTYTTVSDLPDFTEYDFDSPRTEFASGGLQAVEKAQDSKTALLKSLGFNLNISPVVDMASSGDQMMYSRSISDDVETVSSFAEYAAKFTQPKGVSVTLCHFPGYGTIPDGSYTDDGVVLDDRDAASIREKDYTPFKRGAAMGAHCIMMSNVLVKNIDPSHTAALSPSLHSELRDNVGFSGIIMADLTDETDYSAYADGNKPAVQAVIAGNDLILARDYATAYNDILAAAKSGTISAERLKDACTRVLAYKYTAKIAK